MEKAWFENLSGQQFDDYEEDLSRMDLEDQFDLLITEQEPDDGQ